MNSVSQALTAGIAAEGRTILGGDMAFRLTQRTASADELAFLESAGLIGRVANMRGMARVPDGSKPRPESRMVLPLKLIIPLTVTGGSAPGPFRPPGCGWVQPARRASR